MRLTSLSRRGFLFVLLAATTLPAQQIVGNARMEVRHNLPFVQVLVNGQGPFTFGIDTGTGGEAILSAGLIQHLRLQSTGETEVHDATGVNRRKVKVLRVHSLKIGTVEFRNVEATQSPGSMLESIDGILGFPLFREYLLTLDYPHQQLTLARGSLPPANGDQIVPFTMPDEVPVVELNIGTQRIEAHVDSRGRDLSLPSKFAQNLKFVSDPVVLGHGSTISNEFEIKGGQLETDIRLGVYTFPKAFVAINPLFPIANFGAVPLSNFVVTFDQTNQRVRFEAPSRSIVLSAPPRGGSGRPAPKPGPSDH